HARPSDAGGVPRSGWSGPLSKLYQSVMYDDLDRVTQATDLRGQVTQYVYKPLK
ncbi:MAG: hypothetical protein IAG10_01660, partial [Planctomycetaceae bacterium]|nr:hypothetical protein [Planctomycetaceae bacterium]